MHHCALEWIEEHTAQFLRHVEQSLMVDEKARRPVRHHITIAAVQRLATELTREAPPRRFRVEPVESMSLDTDSMDVVISSAVLHFARDASHWMAMVHEMWRVLAPGGLLFARLATTVGQPYLRPLGNGRYVMPDGTTRFLVDHERLLNVTRELGGSLLDPLKSTVVHEQRSMGTWVVRKGERRGS